MMRIHTTKPLQERKGITFQPFIGGRLSLPFFRKCEALELHDIAPGGGWSLDGFLSSRLVLGTASRIHRRILEGRKRRLLHAILNDILLTFDGRDSACLRSPVHSHLDSPLTTYHPILVVRKEPGETGRYGAWRAWNAFLAFFSIKRRGRPNDVHRYCPVDSCLIPLSQTRSVQLMRSPSPFLPCHALAASGASSSYDPNHHPRVRTT